MMKKMLKMIFKIEIFFILCMPLVSVAKNHFNQSPLNPSIMEQSTSYFKAGNYFYEVISKIKVDSAAWKGDFYQLLKIDPKTVRYKYCFNDFFMHELNSMKYKDFTLYFHEKEKHEEVRGYGPPKPATRPFPFIKFMDPENMIYNIPPQKLYGLLPSKKLELCSKEE